MSTEPCKKCSRVPNGTVDEPAIYCSNEIRGRVWFLHGFDFPRELAGNLGCRRPKWVSDLAGLLAHFPDADVVPVTSPDGVAIMQLCLDDPGLRDSVLWLSRKMVWGSNMFDAIREVAGVGDLHRAAGLRRAAAGTGVLP